MNRQDAIKFNEKYYDGKPCKNCKSTKKYTKRRECIKCAYLRSKNRPPEVKLAASKKYYNSHKQRVKNTRIRYSKILGRRYILDLLSHIRWRCNKYKIPFNLEFDDIKIPEFCPVLGIKLAYNYTKDGRGGPNDYSPSVDWIIPEKGYVKDNILIVSNKVNRSRGNLNINEMKKIVEFYGKIITI